jgi:chromosomal replication initiation ATPase DnaA
MTELNPADPWEATPNVLKARVSINTYQSWFSPTRFLRTDRSVIYVLVPTDTFVKVLSRTYGEIIKVCLPKDYDTFKFEIGPENAHVFTERDHTAPGLTLIRKAEELEEIARQLRNLAGRVYP